MVYGTVELRIDAYIVRYIATLAPQTSFLTLSTGYSCLNLAPPELPERKSVKMVATSSGPPIPLFPNMLFASAIAACTAEVLREDKLVP